MKNSPQFKDYYDLLNLFSYGTYLDYACKLSFNKNNVIK